MVVPCRLGMWPTMYGGSVVVCVRSTEYLAVYAVTEGLDNRCDPHAAPARPRWVRSNQIVSLGLPGFGSFEWDEPRGFGLAWLAGGLACVWGYRTANGCARPGCCPRRRQVNQLRPLVLAILLRDTTQVPPSLPAQVQLISLPQRAGQSELCGRREIWKPTHNDGQSPKVAAAVVRSRFVGDCTPEASRSCASMAFWSSAPCACTYACCACASLRRAGSHMPDVAAKRPRFLCLTLTKEGSVLGARSATGCRAVTVAPQQNLFETGKTGNPPRKKTVCAPFPGESPHLRDPSL